MPPNRPHPPPGQLPESLKDPCGDRPVQDVPLPPAQLLTSELLFDKKGKPNLDRLRQHLNLEGILAQELILELIKKASDLFEAEPNMLKLNDPIAVVGDIHGQYFDLVKLFEVGGAPGDTQYLFLGDYVDRGSFSVEVLAMLFAVKILHPKRVRMLRGNHECRQMTAFFNFREECEYKYDEGVYTAFMEAFDMLPVAATINGKFLAVHGGLSPDLPSLKAINALNRFQEPPREGLLCDLLWSDPLETKEGEAATSKKPKKEPLFIHNEVRGCSYYFSFDGAMKFLQKNGMMSIIRAHEAQLEGYKMHKTNPATGFPTVITIFSAPNYCDAYNNKGALLKFDNSTLNILQFNCSPHPYHLPNFMDVFTWSMPFVIEKVTEMLYYILNPPGAGNFELEELPEMPESAKREYRASLTPEQNKAVELATRLAGNLESGTGGVKEKQAGEDGGARERMRKKVRTIAKMARMFKTMRQENETVVRLGGICPGHKLNAGMLLAGKERMTSEVEVFGHVTEIDKTNERCPEAAPAAGSGGSPAGRDFAEVDDAEAVDAEEEEKPEAAPPDKTNEVKVEAVKVEAVKVEAVKVEAVKVEAVTAVPA